MTVREMIMAQLLLLGGNGLVNPDQECGCGEETGGLCPCECVNIDECSAAKWRYCANCPLNGNCDYQREYEVTDGCFYLLETPEEEK